MGVYLLFKEGSAASQVSGRLPVDSSAWESWSGFSFHRFCRVLERDTNQTGLISPVESINVWCSLQMTTVQLVCADTSNVKALIFTIFCPLLVLQVTADTGTLWNNSSKTAAESENRDLMPPPPKKKLNCYLLKDIQSATFQGSNSSCDALDLKIVFS